MVSRALLLEIIRTALGLAALGFIVAGVYGIGGWPWAAITAGLPFTAFYVRGEWRADTSASIDRSTDSPDSPEG